MFGIPTLYARLIGYGVASLAIVATVIWFGAHERGIGAASVQAKWDQAKFSQAQVVANVKAANAARYQDLDEQFNELSNKYEAVTHAQPPSVAPSVASGVRDGSLRLRDAGADSCPGLVPAATARARAADAAATQALADRVQAAIAAVRAGDAADARERQLDAQVIGLQGVLRAERTKP